MTWTTPPTWPTTVATPVTPQALQVVSDDLNDLNSRLSSFQGIPTGVIIPYVGTSVPPNAGQGPYAEWLWCDGEAVSRATFSILFSVIGTTFGAGDGSTTFNVPDLRSRVLVGSNQNNGSPPALGAGLTSRALASTGGEETHTLTTAEMGVHTHTATDSGHSHGGSSAGHSHTASDSGHAHGITDSGHSHDQLSQTMQHGSAANVPILFPFGSPGSLSGQTRVSSQALTGPTTVTGSHTTGMTVATGTSSISGTATTPAVTVNSGTASVTVGSVGGGGAHNNLQPYIVIGFVIRT